MYSNLLKKIEEFDNITIFRHVRPDGDCMFSALALYEFLKDNFKEKKIKVCGYDKYDLISKNDKVSNKFIINSLAICLDTSNTSRIDDFRCMAAKFIVKIDHHPALDDFGELNIVKPEASSTCEVLANILLSKTYSKFRISNKVYEYLYCGIVTDTINFRTSNTTSNTLFIASKLVKCGNLKPSNLVELLMNIDLETYNKVTQIRNMLIVDNKFGYIKLGKKQLKKLNMDPIKAKNNIDEIGTIRDLNIWAFAVENDGAWDCSIRSKRAYIINKIASKYNGGGHPNAAATRQISSEELNLLFKDLADLSKK